MAKSALQVLIAALMLIAGACAAQPYVVISGEQFSVEIADDPGEHARGLMHRQKLATNRGMLFIYNTPATRRFWMKNTLIPLDILFFNAKGELINAVTAPPCEKKPCAIYASEGPALLVLEVNAGTAARLELEPGTKLEVHW